jgi:hypothetical protein
LLPERGNRLADKEMERGAPTVVALVLDLMFASRVRSVAPGAVIARSPEQLLEAVGAETRLVLLDLQVPGWPAALEGLGGRPASVRVVAWGPHVLEAALAAAREAGADEVMPRGAFVKALPALVAEAGG